MTDEMIIDMYWERSEDAISETSKKYSGYCYSIAYGILHNAEDSEECVNDTYLGAWNSMPSNRPSKLPAFLSKITRNLALDKYEYYSAKKRGESQIPLALEELEECLSGSEKTDSVVDAMFIGDILNKFLSTLSEQSRNIFVLRYFHLYSVKEISEKYGISESKVKTSLCRSRTSLKNELRKEDLS